MNSNELNGLILDACLDPACFQILYAYIRLGGWDASKEVYLSREYYERWGIKKRTLSPHRQHLIEAGFLRPTGNKSDAGFDKFNVLVPRVPPVQNQHGPLAESATPPSNICTPPVQDLPTEVINTNEESNEESNEEATHQGDSSEGSSGLILNQKSDGSVADAPSRSSGSITKERILNNIMINGKSSGLLKNAPAAGPPVSEAPGGTPLEEMKAKLRAYHRDASDSELERMARGLLDRQELARLEAERRARAAARPEPELELAW